MSWTNKLSLSSVAHPKSGAMLPVLVTCSQKLIDQWISENIFACKKNAIGFDTEWLSSFRTVDKKESKTSIAQISTDSAILIVQLHRLEKKPPLLSKLLKDGNVVKVGVGVEEDLKKLHKDRGYEYDGYVDVGLTACRVLGTEKHSMKFLATTLLDYNMAKPKSIQLSNWENNLNSRQVNYAALDALISYLIYEEFAAGKNAYDEKTLEAYIEKIANRHRFGGRSDFRAVRVISREISGYMERYGRAIQPLDLKSFLDFYRGNCFDASLILSGRLGWTPCHHTVFINDTERATAICVNGKVIGSATGVSKDIVVNQALMNYMEQILELQKSMNGVELLSTYAGKEKCALVDKFLESKPNLSSWSISFK